MKFILLVFFTLFSSVAFSLDYFGPELSKWPQTEYRKVKDDFAGWLLVTPDLDWQQKWDTPPDTVPQYNEISVVERGRKIVIMSFFVNPKTDSENNANVLCSLKVTRPDGTYSLDEKNAICAKGKLQGLPNYIRLSPLIIQFFGEETDPLGVWVVEVELHDVVRDLKLNLKTEFELVKN